MEEFQKTNPLARGDKNIKSLAIYAEHAKIRKQIYNEIGKLHETLATAYSFPNINSIVSKFLNCLTPLKNLYDPGRLPIYTTVSRSMIPNKRFCVWAVVSCLIQAYWEYELDDTNENIELVEDYLDYLIIVNEHYSEMKITGAENKGYWLEL